MLSSPCDPACRNGGTKPGIGGQQSLGNGFWTKTMATSIVDHSDSALCHHGNPLGHMTREFELLSHVTQRVETVAQSRRIGGQ